MSLSRQQVGVIPLDGVAACANEVVVDERGHVRKCEPNEQRCKKGVIDGVLGHEFIKRFVFEIDYGARLINLYAPENYKYQGTGETLPLDIANQRLAIGLTRAMTETLVQAFCVILKSYLITHTTE